MILSEASKYLYAYYAKQHDENAEQDKGNRTETVGYDMNVPVQIHMYVIIHSTKTVHTIMTLI